MPILRLPPSLLAKSRAITRQRWGEFDFHVNVGPATSSLLAPAARVPRDTPGGDLTCKTLRKVPVIRFDDHADEHQIARIDLLKTDTQGYELEVLRGASRALAAGRIRLVFCEVLFEEYYCGQSYFHDIHSYLLQYRMKFCGLYGCARKPAGELVWADALYLNPDFR